MSDFNYIPCIYLTEDQTKIDALNDAIVEYDAPDIVRIQLWAKPRGATRVDAGGIWVHRHLATADEFEKSAEKHFDYFWSPDRTDRNP